MISDEPVSFNAARMDTNMFLPRVTGYRNLNSQSLLVDMFMCKSTVLSRASPQERTREGNQGSYQIYRKTCNKQLLLRVYSIFVQHVFVVLGTVPSFTHIIKVYYTIFALLLWRPACNEDIIHSLMLV